MSGTVQNDAESTSPARAGGSWITPALTLLLAVGTLTGLSKAQAAPQNDKTAPAWAVPSLLGMQPQTAAFDSKAGKFSDYEVEDVHDNMSAFFKDTTDYKAAGMAVAGKTDPLSVREHDRSQMIDLVRSLPDVDKVKEIAWWVSKAVSYDFVKADEDSDATRMSTLRETLLRGMGICGDDAALVAKTAEDAGIPAENISILTMQLKYNDPARDNAGHAVAMFELGGETYIADGTSGRVDTAQRYFEHLAKAQQAEVTPTTAFSIDGRNVKVFTGNPVLPSMTGPDTAPDTDFQTRHPEIHGQVADTAWEAAVQEKTPTVRPPPVRKTYSAREARF